MADKKIEFLRCENRNCDNYLNKHYFKSKYIMSILQTNLIIVH